MFNNLYSPISAASLIPLVNPHENTRYRFSAVGFGLLMMALLASAYIDWWYDSLSILNLLVIPTVFYLIGAIGKNEKINNIKFVVFSVVSVILAIYMRIISQGANGYYIDPFSKATTIRSAYIALWIIPVSVMIGVLLYKFKINKLIVAIIVTIVSGIAFATQIMDGRIGTIKESFNLLYSVTMKLSTEVEQEIGMPLSLGTPWVYSSENYLGITSSHNMWLDFARDYTVIVFGLLVAFEIWTIIAFIKMIVNKNKRLTDYILIIAFIFFNFHFMFEATGFSNRYIFAFGMLVYGMVASRASD